MTSTSYYTVTYTNATTSTATSDFDSFIRACPVAVVTGDYYEQTSADIPSFINESKEQKQFRIASERAYQLQQMIILSLLLTQTYDKIIIIPVILKRRCSMVLKTFMNLRF